MYDRSKFKIPKSMGPRSDKMVFNSILNFSRVTHFQLCLLDRPMEYSAAACTGIILSNELGPSFDEHLYGVGVEKEPRIIYPNIYILNSDKPLVRANLYISRS